MMCSSAMFNPELFPAAGSDATVRDFLFRNLHAANATHPFGCGVRILAHSLIHIVFELCAIRRRW